MSTVKLESSDGETIVVDVQVGRMSFAIRNMLDNIGMGNEDEVIPMSNVSGAILRKVIDWCIHHKDDPEAPDEDDEKRLEDIPQWDQDFFRVEQPILFDIILAANYMDIKGLLDMGCKTVANMIKGKSAEEIRKTFNIVNDFTPAEEEQIRKENEWCEEK